MDALIPVSFVPLGLLMLVAAVLVAIPLLRFARARGRARRRVREQPNSHYTAPLVRDSETRSRWHGMALERVHEINRAEVVRLLAKVDASGVEVLRPSERTFLDHMTQLAGTRAPAERPEPGKQGVPELRHRPA
ncbi:MAG TPA: hypothetical protein VMM12_03295 [Longimicrobiales bacterium]|nr:hypothetical protein [Longimicrobiales bacterium]